MSKKKSKDHGEPKPPEMSDAERRKLEDEQRKLQIELGNREYEVKVERLRGAIVAAIREELGDDSYYSHRTAVKRAMATVAAQLAYD